MKLFHQFVFICFFPLIHFPKRTKDLLNNVERDYSREINYDCFIHNVISLHSKIANK